MATQMTKYEVLLARIQKEIPGFRVQKRSASWFGKLLGLLIPPGFTQLIGKTMYVSDTFDHYDDTTKYLILRHEVVHARQWKSWFCKYFDYKYLRGINYVAFAFCYLFVLPVLWTYRAKFEREGYEQTILTGMELGHLDLMNKAWHKQRMVDTFTGHNYVWMSTKKRTEEWFEDVFSRALSGELYNDKDRVDLPR